MRALTSTPVRALTFGAHDVPLHPEATVFRVNSATRRSPGSSSMQGGASTPSRTLASRRPSMPSGPPAGRTRFLTASGECGASGKQPIQKRVLHTIHSRPVPPLRGVHSSSCPQSAHAISLRRRQRMYNSMAWGVLYLECHTLCHGLLIHLSRGPLKHAPLTGSFFRPIQQPAAPCKAHHTHMGT
jgi:hypothetical protein